MKQSCSFVQMRQMTKYLLDLTLTSDDFVCTVPSLMASAAVCLARKILVSDKSSWTLGLSYFSRYAERDLIPCMKKMVDLLIKAPDCKFQVRFNVPKKWLTVAFFYIINSHLQQRQFYFPILTMYSKVIGSKELPYIQNESKIARLGASSVNIYVLL